MHCDYTCLAAVHSIGAHHLKLSPVEIFESSVSSRPVHVPAKKFPIAIQCHPFTHIVFSLILTCIVFVHFTVRIVHFKNTSSYFFSLLFISIFPGQHVLYIAVDSSVYCSQKPQHCGRVLHRGYSVKTFSLVWSFSLVWILVAHVWIVVSPVWSKL